MQNTTRTPIFVAALVCLLSSLPAGSNAAEWQSYVGAWRTTNAMRQFPYAQRIVFEFWEADSGSLKGIGVFNKDGSECLGEIARNAPEGKLRFEPLDPSACHGLTGGHFDFVRAFRDDAIMLMFVPDGVDDMTPLMSTHMASYTKLPETPANLRALIAGARTSSGSVADGIQQALATQADALAQLRQRLSVPFRTHYPESQLIGVWRGYLADKLQSYPAELAMWTIKDTTLYEIGGALRFDETGCAATIRVDDTSTRLTFRTGPQQSLSAEPCDRHQLSGLVKIDANGDTLALNLRTSGTHQGDLSMLNCIDALPNAESPEDCEIAGYFQRAAASPAFDDAIASMQWRHDAPAPPPGNWDVLRRNDEGLEDLVAAHEAALEGNAAFFAELEKSYAEAERRREQERRDRIAARKADEAASAARREQTRRDWEQRQHGGAAGGLATALPTLPEVDGPFRDLRGGDFLNALYHGDFEAVATFDRYYGERKVQQRRALIGDTWADGILDTAFRSYRLVDTVLAIYLFYFDRQYSECLRDDAVQFEVVTVVPDTVVENLLGVEVTRHYGWTSREYFWINKEFTDAFRRIGTTKPEGEKAALSDFFLNQGGTDLRQEILAGSKAMMKRFDCNSEAVKQLEQSLLALTRR